MIASPCTGVCTLDADRAYCIGCLRTLAEIADWPKASDAGKRAMLKRIGERRRAQ